MRLGLDRGMVVWQPLLASKRQYGSRFTYLIRAYTDFLEEQEPLLVTETGQVTAPLDR